MSELWEWSQLQSILPAYSESRFSATSAAVSTATSLLPEMPDPLLPAKPDSLLPAKPDPLLPAKPVSPQPGKLDPRLPACSQRSHIVREVWVSMTERWDEACQSCGSYVWSKASCQLIANADSVLPAKPYPLLPACSQRCQFHPYQQSQIHRYQPASSEARLSERWEWAFYCFQLPPSEASLSERWEWAFHSYQLAPSEAECQRGESEHVGAVRPSMSEH